MCSCVCALYGLLCWPPPTYQLCTSYETWGCPYATHKHKASSFIVWQVGLFHSPTMLNIHLRTCSSELFFASVLYTYFLRICACFPFVCARVRAPDCNIKDIWHVWPFLPNYNFLKSDLVVNMVYESLLCNDAKLGVFILVIVICIYTHTCTLIIANFGSELGIIN